MFVLNLQKIRWEANLEEIELGRLDPSLRGVGMKWGKHENEVARFEHAQPGDLLAPCRRVEKIPLLPSDRHLMSRLSGAVATLCVQLGQMRDRLLDNHAVSRHRPHQMPVRVSLAVLAANAGA